VDSPAPMRVAAVGGVSTFAAYGPRLILLRISLNDVRQRVYAALLIRLNSGAGTSKEPMLARRGRWHNGRCFVVILAAAVGDLWTRRWTKFRA
jgi:hypothetical protein